MYVGTIEERVKAGAILLDVSVPGWAHRVKSCYLVMWNPSLCVLAHVHGSYERGKRLLGLTGDRSQAAHYGFNSEVRPWLLFGPLRYYREHAALKAAWLAEIRVRTSPAAAPDPSALALAEAV